MSITLHGRITKRSVDALKPGETLWDTDLKGFGVRCQKTAKTYFYKTRIYGHQKWMTIGQHGKDSWNPGEARKQAGAWRYKIDRCGNPARERDELKHRPMVRDLCERYMEEHAKQHKKPSSIRSDQCIIDNHILPLMGKEFVGDLTIDDFDRFKRAVREGKTAKGPKKGQVGGSVVTGGPGVANRSLAVVSKMMSLAVRWGWHTDNPVRHVQRYPGRKLERFLSADELKALAETLVEEAKEGDIYVASAVRLLILTGARLGEILDLQWDYFDRAKSVLRLPDSKTGAKLIYLNAAALEVLEGIPRKSDNPWVICGRESGHGLVNIRKPWHRIRRRATIRLWQQNPAAAEVIAGIELDPERPNVAKLKAALTAQDIDVPWSMEDLRLHDLRHSFASFAVENGLSLPVIGKLLGHAHQATTQRYAHLADDPIRAANDIVGEHISAVMKL